MKKQILLTLIILIIGIIIGNKIHKATNSFKNVFKEDEIYYFLQEGVYNSQQILEENTNKLNFKIVEELDSKYYVYLGITRSTSIASKLKEIYENKGYNIYIKEINLNNQEFKSNLEQFDLLINSTQNEEEILTIEEVVLANYEEIIKNSKEN